MALKHWKRKVKSGKMVLALLMQIALLKRQGVLNGDIANREVANVLQIWTALMFILSVLNGDSASQRCIFRLTCSHPELTEDHVLTSA